MTTWTVSRVTPSHACFNAITDHQEALLVDEVSSHAAAEPELALGLRLFWATILALALVVVIPITVRWMLQSTPDLSPEALIRPAILADRVVPAPKVVLPHQLPKVQAPPLELLLGIASHLALTGEE
jgi:hypothetical protein